MALPRGESRDHSTSAASRPRGSGVWFASFGKSLPERVPRPCETLQRFPLRFCRYRRYASEDSPSLDRAVAERYSYTPQGIRELVALGVLHPVRLTPRGHYRFRAEEVEQLVSDERKVPA
jgi:hypothetical protein